MSAPEQATASGPLASILALPNDSGKKTLFMAIVVCLICSIIVATAAVALRPQQIANQEADRIRNIVEVAGVLRPGETIIQAFEKIEMQMIELDTGAETNAFDPATFDLERVSKDPDLSRPLRRSEDPAGIKRRPEVMTVYMVRNGDGALTTLVLPVYGSGLWGTMYGFLALDGDLRTAQGLKFYQHAETPGLGGEVDNPNWRAVWEGKLLYDDAGQPRLEVIKGTVGPATPDAEHKIDGLAGATLTARGVQNLVNYWLGDNGYGPFIDRLRKQGKGVSNG